ncbi:hypothetical protein [Spirosoma endophyticum]|uniref:Oligosaccharide repeat unit polymerase n=1 Tax=Spirosoma endophyticum TaxID=662367 RepID=A0A1I2FYA7_9BACT|nr:hypothetical protein [Spirosoma endophyticum]SFF09883.1 hypothetical protein SAMN05216167_12840 [Spirosoma endophyticum]
MKRLLVCALAFLLAIQCVDYCTGTEALAVALSLYTFQTFVHRVGERIALLECISFIAALEILLVPAITYWVFPASMPVESATYFSYTLPAYSTFHIGLFWLRKNDSKRPHLLYIQDATAYLQDKKAASFVLLIIGLLGFSVKTFVPTAPTILGTLPAYCLFISAFYAYYSGSLYRVLILTTVFAVLVTYTIQAGMFGELFFWIMLLVIFSAAGRLNPLTIRTKTIFVSLAFVFLLLIQSIKGEYRYNTWGHQRGERTGNAGLMSDLLTDRLTHPEKLLNVDHLFLSFVRFNQGIMIGSAMTKVPMHESYANGDVLLSFIYPFVPRLMWPNKPQTGGYENIRRFTTLPQSENTSINLSPLGEGYVNFGYGGILFSLLYGLLLSGVFRYVLQLAAHVPSLILWLPMLYIGCLTMETDLLSTWGSLVNNAIFIALLFWFMKRIGIHL